MFPDLADTDEPPQCELCCGYPGAHDHLCPYNELEVPDWYDPEEG